MKIKISKDELFKMDAVEVYKLVLTGEINSFPAGFWQLNEAYDNASKCVKYLIEEVLCWNEEDLLKNMCQKILKNHKLKGMLTTLFDDVTFDVINYVYPNKYKAWQFRVVPKNFWKDDNNCREALLWLIDEKLKLSDEDIKRYWNADLICGHGLAGLLKRRFSRSPYLALNYAKPGKFKPADLAYTSKEYWNDKDNVADYLHKFFVIDKGMNSSQISDLRCEDFYSNGFSTLIHSKKYRIHELKDLILSRC